MSNAAANALDNGDEPLEVATIGSQIEQLTRQSTVPTELAPGVLGGVKADGTLDVQDINDLIEKYATAPRRKHGSHALHDPESFIAYIARHGDDKGTEVYADRFHLSITAVINGDQAAGSPAGWADHRAMYQLRQTPEWVAWMTSNAKWLSQTEMAEHFEDRLPDIIEPDGATMLEVAQSIKAASSGQFQSSQRLSNGSTVLTYVEEVSGQAQNAAKQSIAIPEQFALQLQPFEGSPGYKVPCRFRYRIDGGTLRLLYKLDRPEEVLREAFQDVTATIADGITQPIWSGSQP